MLIESPSFLEFFTSCNSSNVFILLPSALTIKSPLLNPAFSADEYSVTSTTYNPSSKFNFLANVSSTTLTDTPKFNSGLDNESIFSFTSFIGIANPIPSAPSLAFNVLIPITWPLVFINGPPLLPALIAVSVCIKFVLTPDCV